jgi:hypothetical protein
MRNSVIEERLRILWHASALGMLDRLEELLGGRPDYVAVALD